MNGMVSIESKPTAEPAEIRRTWEQQRSVHAWKCIALPSVHVAKRGRLVAIRLQIAQEQSGPVKPLTTPPPPKQTENNPKADRRFTLPERIAA